MFKAKIKSVAFVEFPVTDCMSEKAGPFDILIDIDLQNSNRNPLAFPLENYCLALLQKICTIGNDQLKTFITYQQQLMSDQVSWLVSLDELIVSNAEIFENKLLLLKAEKTLFIIELALEKIRNCDKPETVIFDFEQVKVKIKNITSIEDQLVYLYTVKAEYLQTPKVQPDPSGIPFDRKILIEIEKIHELQGALGHLKNKHTAKNRLLEDYIDNEEFLQVMKISKRTSQNWRDTGRIGYSQIGNKIYYLFADVESLLKSNYIKSLKR